MMWQLTLVQYSRHIPAVTITDGRLYLAFGIVHLTFHAGRPQSHRAEARNFVLLTSDAGRKVFVSNWDRTRALHLDFRS